MDTGLVHLHSFLRWVILVLLIISIVKSYNGWKGKRLFTAGDRKTWLFTMIAAHITFVLGLYQVLAGRIGIITTTLPEGSSFMKEKGYRFFWLEHPLLMFIAIALITMGYGMSKKAVSDEMKFKKAFRFFIIALVLMLIGIPWPFREIIGRPWFPGM
jgi:hypothetical protein